MLFRSIANNIMKQLPREQRPYEKCFMQGEGSLNDTELLAVILRSGTSGKNSLGSCFIILFALFISLPVLSKASGQIANYILA